MGRDSLFSGRSPAARAGGMRRTAPFEEIVAVLELTATEQPELFDFQVHVLRNSSMRYAFGELAAIVGVAVERLPATIFKACRDLKKLERRRGAWSDPGALVESPNVAALCHVCAARLGRVQGIGHRRRLEATLRRLRAAHELARSRAWIEEFIKPPSSDRKQDKRADH